MSRWWKKIKSGLLLRARYVTVTVTSILLGKRGRSGLLLRARYVTLKSDLRKVGGVLLGKKTGGGLSLGKRGRSGLLLRARYVTLGKRTKSVLVVVMLGVAVFGMVWAGTYTETFTAAGNYSFRDSLGIGIQN